MEEELGVPVYLITGFLESGKTTFIKNTVSAEYFQIDEPTLVITCEEGEEEYHKGEMLKYGTLVETIEDEDDFTKEKLTELTRVHKPGRIILEYNPLWSVKKLYEMDLPDDWEIIQHIVTVDASTFQVYMNNMKSLFVEMITGADLVAFNRCEEDQPLPAFRRSIKVVNPSTDIVFEDENNEPMDIFSDTVPYDLDQDVIDIDDVDFGIFYVDLRDNPKRYIGRKVRFTGNVLKNKRGYDDIFLPARKAMTCCAEDIRYIGYVCEYNKTKDLQSGSWVNVLATVKWGSSPAYKGEGPIFSAIEVQETDPPKEELVYFN